MSEAINTVHGILHDPHQPLDAILAPHDHEAVESALPTAIRPYPRQYVQLWTMKDGAKVTIRPIRLEDEPLMARFHETLSDRSVYYRYFHLIKLSQRVTHDRLMHICFVDYIHEMALVVDYENPTTKEHEIHGVGRLIKHRELNEAEFAVIVSDQWQKRGLGSELLRRLLQVGRDWKLARITADILPDNIDMQRVCKKLGFQIEFDRGERLMKACIDL
jgi:acetyltransferase